MAQKNMLVALHIPSLNLHSMQTRSKSGIVKRKTCFTVIKASGDTDPSLIEPTSYKSPVQVPVWLKAIKEEIVALHS